MDVREGGVIPIKQTDAFVAWAARIIAGAAELSEAKAVHVVELDHWFDEKWLEFSGKALGALGVWKVNTTVPPFHPNRVVGEAHYQRADLGGYVAVIDGPRIHREQSSSQNLQRRFSQVLPDAACFWYSSDGPAVGRAALMGYVPAGGDLSTWSLGATCKASVWTPATLRGIASQELSHLEEVGVRRAG